MGERDPATLTSAARDPTIRSKIWRQIEEEERTRIARAVKPAQECRRWLEDAERHGGPAPFIRSRSTRR
jgi:hypothetical protein